MTARAAGYAIDEKAWVNESREVGQLYVRRRRGGEPLVEYTAFRRGDLVSAVRKDTRLFKTGADAGSVAGRRSVVFDVAGVALDFVRQFGLLDVLDPAGIG